MYLQLEQVNDCLVVRGWSAEEPAKTHDYVTGDISLDPKDLSPSLAVYTGTAEDGSTDGALEIKWYCHVNTEGNVVGIDPYCIDGVVQSVPAKKSDYVTGGIAITNQQRMSAFSYSGTLEDGSTDGSCT